MLDLSWWGADADGEISRYQYRWDSFWEPDSSDTLADGWVETVTTARRFVIEVGGTHAVPTFEVRAIDDRDVADPTPVVQTFRVYNQRPAVFFTDSIPRPNRSLPAVTFSVGASDPDGPESLSGYRAWFEGEDFETESRFFSGSVSSNLSLAPMDFPSSGMVTLHIVAVDESNTTSADSLHHTWEVIDIEGRRMLVVDQYPDGLTFGPELDAFYRDNAEEVVGGDAVIVLSYERDGGFRTSDEVRLGLPAFESVVWYTGVQWDDIAGTRSRLANLRAARPGIEAYVRGGGQVLLQSTFAFADVRPRSQGGGTRDWDAAWDSLATHEFLGRAAFEENPDQNSNFTLLFSRIFTENDTLSTVGVANYVDFIGPVPGGVPVAWVPPGTVSIGFDEFGNQIFNPVDFVCGISVPIESGRFVGLTFPLSRLNGAGNADDYLRSLLREFDP